MSGYVNMRKGSGNRKVVTATPRQLDGLVRLSESIAKMRFSRRVEANDVQEAMRLMKNATQTAATDPRTGCIDMDAIVTGRTAAMREETEQIGEAIMQLVQAAARSGISQHELLKQLQDASSLPISQDQMQTASRTLEQEGKLRMSGSGDKRKYMVA